MSCFLFSLRFTAPVHFGLSDAALSLYASEESFCADTLFSALCHTALRAEGEAARRVVEDGNDFGAANKKKLDELLWRKLRELKDGDEIDGKLHDLVLSSARLTAQVRANRESEGKLKLLEAKLAELAREKAEWERKEKEREEAKKKAIADIRNGGGLSDEALAKLEAQIGSL